MGRYSWYKLPMKRRVVFLLFIAFSWGIAAESLEADCALQNESAPCCVCLCHTPAASPDFSRIQPVPFHPAAFTPYESPMSGSLLVKLIFHPPKTHA